MIQALLAYRLSFSRCANCLVLLVHPAAFGPQKCCLSVHSMHFIYAHSSKITEQLPWPEARLTSTLQPQTDPRGLPQTCCMHAECSQSAASRRNITCCVVKFVVSMRVHNVDIGHVYLNNRRRRYRRHNSQYAEQMDRVIILSHHVHISTQHEVLVK